MNLKNNDSQIYSFKVPEGWKLLALENESQPYDVDIVEIWKTTDGYALLTASGCSCWDGEYEEVQYPNLQLLALALFRRDHQYSPSLNGALYLLKQVFENDA